MSKHNSAPTVGWTISSQLNKWLALAFIILILVLILETVWIFSAVNRDCKEAYKIKNKLGSHWMVIFVGSSNDGCSNAY